MSEDSEQRETGDAQAVSLSHRRILWTMLFVAIVGAVFGVWFVSWQFGLGVFTGGALAFLNYFWLKNSLRAVFEREVHADRPKFLAGKYFLRYLVFGAVLLIVFLTKTLPVTSVILGLASFAFAVLIEGLARIFSTFIKK